MASAFAFGLFGVSRVHGFYDDPAPWPWASALALGLSSSAAHWVIDEVEDPATAGDLVLPPVKPLALVDTGAHRPALEFALPGGELGWVSSQLIVGRRERVRLLFGPSVPVLGDPLVGCQDLPFIRAGGADNGFVAGQGQPVFGRWIGTGGPVCPASSLTRSSGTP
jgi:hypothetical protein